MSSSHLPEKLEKLSNAEIDQILTKDAKSRQKVTKDLQWFHPSTNRALSETRLKKFGRSVGTFLIRENASSPGDFVVSLITGTEKKKCIIQHFVIIQRKERMYSFSGSTDSFDGLDNFVLHYSHEADRLPTALRHPCPRGQVPPPLSMKMGYTNVLHMVISGKSYTEQDALRILKSEHHPAVNEKSVEGSTAMHLCCKRGFRNVVEKLIKMDAEIDMADASGNFPLMLACSYGFEEIVHLLLNAGADPQCRHADTGNVALHEAAANGHVQCVKQMLDFHVPVWPRNFKKESPFVLATNAGHQTIAKMLEDYIPRKPRVSRSDWFHENLNRQAAADLLAKYHNAEGHFLVRKNSRDPDKYVLTASFNSKVYNILVFNKPLFYIESGPFFRSLEHFVEHYCMYADGLEGRLTHAIRPGGGLKCLGIDRFGARQSNLRRQESFLPPPVPRMKATTKDPTNLDPKSITLEYEIGQGEFGSVMKGTWTSPYGQAVPVAIKMLNPKYMDSDRENFLREAQVMVRFDNPHIVKLIGVCEAECLMLVQELVRMGALLDYLLDYPEKILVNRDLCLWAGQIAHGMMYLEREGFVHRDLAARNILLSSRTQVKVGDFGLSRAVGTSNYYVASKGGRWPVKWYAPESVNYGTFSSKSDIWSYGITLWEMFTFGDQPYGTMTGTEVIQYLESKRRLECPQKCPENVYQIMLKCWAYVPADRPSFSELAQIFRRNEEYMNTMDLLPHLDQTSA